MHYINQGILHLVACKREPPSTCEYSSEESGVERQLCWSCSAPPFYNHMLDTCRIVKHVRAHVAVL